MRVQGATVRAREAWVLARQGLEARKRYRAEASPALRACLETARDERGGWVDFSLFVEATVLADRMFGRGDLGLAWDLGRFAASYNLGMWKGLLMRRVSPTTVLSLAASMWSHHYDGGKLMTRAAGARGVHVTIVDFPTPHRAHCLSIGGWMLGTLELGPRRNILVREASCRALGAPSCEFDLGWD